MLTALLTTYGFSVLGGVLSGTVLGSLGPTTVQVSPLVLRAARCGLKNLKASQREATSKEIAIIEESGAQRATLEGWF